MDLHYHSTHRYFTISRFSIYIYRTFQINKDKKVYLKLIDYVMEYTAHKNSENVPTLYNILILSLSLAKIIDKIKISC